MADPDRQIETFVDQVGHAVAEFGIDASLRQTL